MKRSYVDLLVRVMVEHPDEGDPQDVIQESEMYFHGPLDPADGRIVSEDIKESVTVGTVDPDSEALVREDGQTGRDVMMVHSPDDDLE